MRWKTVGFLYFLATILLCPLVVYGDDAVNETEQKAGFTLEAVIPENQVDERKSYFYLQVNQTHQQKVAIKIFNATETEQTYRVEVNTAKTNKNGLIIYDDFTTPIDDSLRLPLTEVVHPEQERMTVPAWGEGEAVLMIQLNQQPFDGVLLGGVRISLEEPETEESTVKGSMGVANTYAYVIGMTLVQQADTPLFGATELRLLKLEPQVESGSKVLHAFFQNPHPEIMENLVMEAKVVKKGQTQAVLEKEMGGIRIAPQSQFPLELDWGNQEVVPGTYVFQATAQSKGEEWTFEKEFEITAEEAKEMNDEAVFKLILPDWWKLGGGLLASFSFLLFVGLMIRMIRRKEGGTRT